MKKTVKGILNSLVAVLVIVFSFFISFAFIDESNYYNQNTELNSTKDEFYNKQTYGEPTPYARCPEPRDWDYINDLDTDCLQDMEKIEKYDSPSFSGDGDGYNGDWYSVLNGTDLETDNPLPIVGGEESITFTFWINGDFYVEYNSVNPGTIDNYYVGYTLDKSRTFYNAEDEYGNKLKVKDLEHTFYDILGGEIPGDQRDNQFVSITIPNIPPGEYYAGNMALTIGHNENPKGLVEISNQAPSQDVNSTVDYWSWSFTEAGSLPIIVTSSIYNDPSIDSFSVTTLHNSIEIMYQISDSNYKIDRSSYTLKDESDVNVSSGNLEKENGINSLLITDLTESTKYILNVEFTYVDINNNSETELFYREIEIVTQSEEYERPPEITSAKLMPSYNSVYVEIFIYDIEYYMLSGNPWGGGRIEYKIDGELRGTEIKNSTTSGSKSAIFRFTIHDLEPNTTYDIDFISYFPKPFSGGVPERADSYHTEFTTLSDEVKSAPVLNSIDVTSGINDALVQIKIEDDDSVATEIRYKIDDNPVQFASINSDGTSEIKLESLNSNQTYSLEIELIYSTGAYIDPTVFSTIEFTTLNPSSTTIVPEVSDFLVTQKNSSDVVVDIRVNDPDNALNSIEYKLNGSSAKISMPSSQIGSEKLVQINFNDLEKNFNYILEYRLVYNDESSVVKTAYNRNTFSLSEIPNTAPTTDSFSLTQKENGVEVRIVSNDIDNALINLEYKIDETETVLVSPTEISPINKEFMFSISDLILEQSYTLEFRYIYSLDSSSTESFTNWEEESFVFQGIPVDITPPTTGDLTSDTVDNKIIIRIKIIDPDNVFDYIEYRFNEEEFKLTDSSNIVDSSNGVKIVEIESGEITLGQEVSFEYTIYYNDDSTSSSSESSSIKIETVLEGSEFETWKIITIVVSSVVFIFLLLMSCFLLFDKNDK